MYDGLRALGRPARGQLVPPEVVDGIVGGPYDDIVSTAGGFLVGLVVTYTLGRLFVAPGIIRIVAARNRNNPTLETAVATYSHVLVILVALVVGIASAGLWSLLTNLSIVVAALTLVAGAASQDVVGSLVSGLFLIGDPEFNVGDWIAWPGGEGVVEAVDFRVTRVRTPNNETISVPNTHLTANTLTRPYGRDRFRVVEAFQVAYGDDVELALRELVEVAHDEDRILDDPTPTATLAAFEGSAVRIQAEFWVEDPMDVDLVTLQSDYRREVKARFDDIGLTLGPPTGQELSGSVDVDLAGDDAAE